MADQNPKMLLASIPKSGTNLFRVAMFNYLAHLKGDLEPKTYDDMIAAFPNEIANYKKGDEKKPNRQYLPEKYSDFVYGHAITAACKLTGPIIGLYRNPLDQLISAYFYFYTRNNSNTSHPRDIIEERTPRFIRPYKRMREMEAGGRALLLSYEDMIERPSDCIARAADFYKLPVSDELASMAAEHSSIKRAKKFEDENGHMHTPNRSKAKKLIGKNNRFVRDGRIGQWQDWFTDDDVNQIKAKLVDAGIDPDDFVYSPRV
ncbi:sulfotransferase domain-containing protein [Glycocaulis abyssi]|uniref:Sulfotransferase domain-containing protein n=1 Tax=Glycocaulis abyssi TaxID=1433403 RepID=A0ABV9N9P1_9PROT